MNEIFRVPLQLNQSLRSRYLRMFLLNVVGARRLPLELLPAAETLEALLRAVERLVTVQVDLGRESFRAHCTIVSLGNVLAKDVALERVGGDVLLAQAAPDVALRTLVDVLLGVLADLRLGLWCFGHFSGVSQWSAAGSPEECRRIPGGVSQKLTERSSLNEAH